MCCGAEHLRVVRRAEGRAAVSGGAGRVGGGYASAAGWSGAVVVADEAVLRGRIADPDAVVGCGDDAGRAGGELQCGGCVDERGTAVHGDGAYAARALPGLRSRGVAVVRRDHHRWGVDAGGTAGEGRGGRRDRDSGVRDDGDRSGCVYAGVPLDGTAVEIGADGRILIKGSTLFSGYRLRPELTAEVVRDGWFRTQDRGELLDGRLRVIGRVDDVVISGGVNVTLTTVQTRLLEHPQVKDAVVL